MHHNLIIKDGDTTKVVKEVLVDGIQFVDEKPREGSVNFVTSDGVAKAVGGASDALQDQIDEIAEKAGSGYIPKGEATVATLNALSGQENGELYTMTDAGTLTLGSLAVVAGDTVAWDATNSVWYKAMDYAPAQYGMNEVHNLPTTITAFRTGDYVVVDGTSGTAKMSKDTLIAITEQTGTSLQLVNGNRDISNQVFFEIGAVTFAGSGWTYTADNRRIRTPQDKPIHLMSGQKIGLSDYTNAGMYIGWVNAQGQYKYRGWLRDDLLCVEEADYTIMIAHMPDGSALSNVMELAQLFVQPNSLKEEGLRKLDCNYTNDAIGFNVFEMGQITFNWGAPPTYGYDGRRVRTRQNEGIYYKKGDVIGLSDYTNARFYPGWVNTQGQYKYSGWKNEDYTCTEDGLYFIMIAHKTESPLPTTIDLTSVEELSHLWLNRVSVSAKTLNVEINAINEKTETVKEELAEITEEVVNYEDVTEQKEFVIGTTSSLLWPGGAYTQNRMVSVMFECYPGSSVTLNCGDNYDFVLLSSSSKTSAVNWQDSGWLAGDTAITANNRYVRLLVRASANHPSGLNADLTNADVSNLSASDIDYAKVIATPVPYGYNKFERNRKIENALTNPFRNGMLYYYHCGLDVSGDDIIVPSQSLADIDMAFRLGFTVYEINSLFVVDGVIMQHGTTTTTFRRDCVIDSEGNYANDVNASLLTLAEIESTYKYKSKFKHFETPLTEYNEGLLAIKHHGMIPFVSFNISNAGVLRDDVRKIFGDDYIAYQGNVQTDNAMIMKWSSLTTKSAILEECDAIGSPYLHMPTTATISQWMKDVASEFAGETITDVHLYFDSLTFENQVSLIEAEIGFFKDLADAVHEKGCLIGWAASYCDEQTTQMLRLSGWDAAASKNQVNDFGHGDIFSYEMINSLDGISTVGVLEDGVLKFSGAGYVRKTGLDYVFMSKAVLKIKFVGTLFVKLYGDSYNKFVSDGSKEFVISTYFLDTTPGFDIYNSEAVQILELSFNVSAC